MPKSNPINSPNLLTVGRMMNQNFKSLLEDDSLRTVVEYYHEFKVTTLPVVDDAEKLVGVFPRKRLFRAFLDGEIWNKPCKKTMV